jgi:hypothetical protein
MANQRRGLASESIFQRISTAVQAFLALLFERETWQALARWVFWRVLPKRRRILKLVTELKPLAENAPPEMHALRDEVFSKSCLELRQLKDQQVLLDILNHVEQPLGLEQIFFAAVYPVLVKRDLEAIPIVREVPHRLDVEIGYLAHNEDYFYWVFEIDSNRRMSLKTPLEVREEQREDKRIAIYTLGCTGLVETDFAAYAEQWLMNAPRLSIALPLLATAYAEQWILNARIYFAHILKDLKKRNYKVTAEAIPDFERARLSILRHLSLLRLNKRQFQSSRRKR